MVNVLASIVVVFFHLFGFFLSQKLKTVEKSAHLCISELYCRI